MIATLSRIKVEVEVLVSLQGKEAIAASARMKRAYGEASPRSTRAVTLVMLEPRKQTFGCVPGGSSRDAKNDGESLKKEDAVGKGSLENL